jgi:hypothetical protein
VEARLTINQLFDFENKPCWKETYGMLATTKALGSPLNQTAIGQSRHTAFHAGSRSTMLVVLLRESESCIWGLTPPPISQ